MPTFGVVKRAKPWLQVERGFDPNQPSKNTRAYRVKTGVTILSGQVISTAYDAGDDVQEWELGWAAGRIPYIALQDSTQEDVVSANSLVGLSPIGEFVLRTGYYKVGDTYNVDTPIAPDGVTGNVFVTTLESGLPIMGYVTKRITDLAGYAGPGGYPTVSGVVDGNVIAFQTHYLPNTADEIA